MHRYPSFQVIFRCSLITLTLKLSNDALNGCEGVKRYGNRCGIETDLKDGGRRYLEYLRAVEAPKLRAVEAHKLLLAWRTCQA